MGMELVYTSVPPSLTSSGLGSAWGKAADYKISYFTSDTKVLARAISPTFKLFLNSTSHWLH